MCNKVVAERPGLFEDVPYNLNTQDRCSKADVEFPYLLNYVPDRFKTRGKCNKAVAAVPDWFVTSQMLENPNPRLMPIAGGKHRNIESVVNYSQ